MGRNTRAVRRSGRTCWPFFGGTLFKCVTVGVIGAVFVDDDVAAAEVAQAFEQAVRVLCVEVWLSWLFPF
jgi:hypothetical protein